MSLPVYLNWYAFIVIYFTSLFIKIIDVCLLKTKWFKLENRYIYITLTLYIYINCNCYWCPYRVAGCTTVWSWFISLYVCDFKDRPVVKHNAGTVCFEPLPHNTCVRICIGQYTSQCSCLSLCNFVWTKGTWCHFWFIYQTVVNNIAYSAGKSFLGYFGYLFIKI